MGHFWSSRRGGHPRYQQNQFISESPLPPSPSSPEAFPLPLPPLSVARAPPSTYAFAVNGLCPARQNPRQNPCPNFPASSSFYGVRPTMVQYNYQPFHRNQGNGWPGFRPPGAPPPYVDNQSAKKIKNDVNVHKDSIRLQWDEKNPDSFLVSFTFDAVVDGSITIFYFCKEGANCTFTPLYPEIHVPVKIPFQKGLGQKFFQPSGTGIDLGFFNINDLSNPFPGEDIFPLVISAESSSMTLSKDLGESALTAVPHAQITQAVLEKNNDNYFQVKVIKQILWFDGIRYELREIYGFSNANEATINGNESGKECVICMTELKDTAVLPCRHLCMCSECAKALSLQSDKCPICRKPIEEFIEIKVNEAKS